KKKNYMYGLYLMESGVSIAKKKEKRYKNRCFLYGVTWRQIGVTMESLFFMMEAKWSHNGVNGVIMESQKVKESYGLMVLK
ncbi:MAG: hypothetical protein Q8788_02305, partial [Candidatus Phytoplasma australasiaticum]|nr:hypothetical protein [Candidatus Phytoplasma australasiaticum]